MAYSLSQFMISINADEAILKKKETLRNHESKSMEYDVIFLVK